MSFAEPKKDWRARNFDSINVSPQENFDSCFAHHTSWSHHKGLDKYRAFWPSIRSIDHDSHNHSGDFIIFGVQEPRGREKFAASMHLPSHTRGQRIAPPRIVLRRTFARSGGIFNCSFFNGHDATSEKCDYPICRLQSRQIEAQATTELAKARRSTAADETTPSGSSSCQQSTSVLSKQGLLWLIMTIFLFGSSSEALSLIEKKGPYFCVEHMAPPLNSREPNNPYARCLPITYTNDPKVAHKWIKHYIAPKSVVGFDIEVSPRRDGG